MLASRDLLCWPYRKSMGLEKSLQVVKAMDDKHELDHDLVAVLTENAKEIGDILREEEIHTSAHYHKFIEGLKA